MNILQSEVIDKYFEKVSNGEWIYFKKRLICQTNSGNQHP